MAQPETVAELQRLVVAALDQVGKAYRSGHHRKASRLTTELREALAGEAPVPPVVPASRRLPPGSRGIDWQAVLSAARDADQTIVKLAREHKVTPQAAWKACKTHGIALRYSDRSNTVRKRPVADPPPLQEQQAEISEPASVPKNASVPAEEPTPRLEGASDQAPEPEAAEPVELTDPPADPVPLVDEQPSTLASAPARPITPIAVGGIDKWKRDRIVSDLIAGRPLERIVVLRSVPMAVVEAERDAFLNGGGKTQRAHP